MGIEVYKPVSKTKYNKCVNEAKKFTKLLRLATGHRMKIAGLAYECAYISKGGRFPKGVYTLKMFAEDIGVKPATLYEWCRIYSNVYSKLDKKRQETFEEMGTLASREVCKGIKKEDSDKVVKKRMDKVSKSSFITCKYTKYLRHIDSLIWNLSSYSRAHEVDLETLKRVRERTATLINLVDINIKLKNGDIAITPKVKKKLPADFWDTFE